MIKKILFQLFFEKFNKIATKINLKPEELELKDEKCLCLAPHPDDEAIGLGGVLNLYPDNFNVVLLTNGCKGIANETQKNTVKIRSDEFETAMNFAKIKKFSMLDIDDKKLFKGAAKFKEINFKNYDCIFIPNIIDQHPDHKAVSLLLKEIMENGHDFKPTLKICFYEVWSALPFVNAFVDIESVKEQKKAMINCYKSQIATKDYNYYIGGLNKYRGMFKNKKTAEAFFVTNKESFLKICEIYK